MCIIVTDRDGTPVLNVKADSCMEIGLATKPSFIATYTMATDQASKLGLGKNQSIVCMYSNYQVSISYDFLDLKPFGVCQLNKKKSYFFF